MAQLLHQHQRPGLSVLLDLRRVGPAEVRSLEALYAWLQPGELLDNGVPKHALFQHFWRESRSDSFKPPPKVVAMRGTR